ncbi:MAG: ATP-grasp domain-containing protein [Erysipelotrichaceae bacterium]|uniref:ATP-grasp domain-containing protein n=1 Tax=Floccifex sp. TaxID=2815810 RepID=UPI0029FED90E|nr:ATP-grasp domain-containing protein [Floccifex sp.]MDD7281805.1 ATP-grasp domain-containing protein [Erysipelotrichaceae bacterium]MDY2957434.1 ATP-grasp domain-containing protein [Floccifex sp.]
MNFVFISPNYPDTYWMFCRGLKKYGAKVLAIVDTPYNSLQPELKAHCDECYVVSSFHNYDEMVRALGYFTFKYGKIDWIESNNEAWLTLDARLRDNFNVKTGFSFSQIDEFQSKAAMKKYYESVGIPTARYLLVDSLESALDFAHKVGYPLVLKPDHGVGASFTYKLQSDEDLRHYYNQTMQYHMILEEYIDGTVFTLDGLCDGNSNIRFLSSMEYIGSCMDSVNNQLSMASYTTLEISDEYRQLAQKTIKAFKLKNRFFHCEFFRLNKDIEGLGPKGFVLGLEVNFRPPGGICPDLMNYACDIDVYDLWAQLLLTQNCPDIINKPYSAGFAGRRDSIHYKYSIEKLQNEFKDDIIYVKHLPKAFAAAMGDELIVARWKTKENRDAFYQKALMIEN